MNRETKIPSIPGPNVSLPKSVQALKEIAQVREGKRGDPLDRFVRVRDLLTDEDVLQRLDDRYYTRKTLTTNVAGPTDDLDVTGINTLFIDCSANDVTIGGFVGGVNGQHLSIARLCAGAFTAKLEHLEGGGYQDIYLHKGADESLLGEHGGWDLVCNGTGWFDVSHAKHV